MSANYSAYNMDNLRYVFNHTQYGITCFEYDEPIELSWPLEKKLQSLSSAHCIEFNKQAAIMLNHPNENLLGLPLATLFVNNEINKSTLAAFFENKGYASQIRLYVLDYQGNPKWFEIELISAVADNKLLRTWSVGLDITEQIHVKDQLHDAFEETIAALATTVELRDLYTANHQKRVAHLAATIGEELGLNNETILWLRLAATIHDIGKIKIPAEILTKPDRLTIPEFEIIKQHPQAGYSILKDIQFPMPVAEAVYQHHEYLDGSGYPRGLKDDQIILFARIITVADIVQAMSSHRPYRAAMGIEAALEQITKMRGRQLDPQIVDVCLQLFRKKHYQFPT